jgi:NAD(P)-dependent dehydrogenase (short-subunit alcohol dehydrogenase family)
LTRTLALEASEYNIRVNVVGAGDVLTNILNEAASDGNGLAALATHGEGAPVGRAANPKEIAEVVLFLASERASFVLGSVVMADGGMSVKVGS